MAKLKHWTTKSGYTIVRLLSGRSNVFLLSDKDKHILIDTSPAYQWKLLAKRLKNAGIEKIDLLILTHCHYDHAANAKKLKQIYKAGVIIHQDETELLAKGQNSIIQGTNRFSKFITSVLVKVFVQLKDYKPCDYDYSVNSRFDLSEFGFNAYILHTPGHTQGSLSVIIDDEIALVGDCMFGVFKSSVFPPFAQNVEQLVESWGKLLETGCKLFLPSHGGEKCREQLERDYRKRK